MACPRVEHVLLGCPGVVEVAVFPVPDADLGERVAAVVVTADLDGPDPDALAAFAGSRLAHFEVPEHWIVTHDILPTLPTGKIDKAALRGLVTARSTPTG